MRLTRSIIYTSSLSIGYLSIARKTMLITIQTDIKIEKALEFTKFMTDFSKNPAFLLRLLRWINSWIGMLGSPVSVLGSMTSNI